MSDSSNYTENKALNWLKGTDLGTAPTALHTALYNGSPGEDGASGTEVTTTINAAGRVAMTFATPTGTGATRSIEQNADCDFNTAAAGATVDNVAFFDASTSGNLLFYGDITSKTVASGDGVVISDSNTTLSLTGDLSPYLKDQLLNWLRGTAADSAPAAVYCALYNGDPTGAGTEVTLTIDPTGRKAITFGAISSGQISNSAAVDFGTADSSATIDYLAVYDAASGGNLLAYKAISAKAPAAGDGVKIEIGALSVTIN